MTGFIIIIVVFVIIVFVGTGLVGFLADSIGAAVIAFLILGSIFGGWIASMAFTSFVEEKIITCTVISKDRGGGDDGAYRVYTEECGVLANGDNPFWNKYNSADIWTEIPDSGPVTVQVVGVRNGFMSWFPNIIDVQETQFAG